RRVDPLAKGVPVLVARIIELAALDVDRLAGEEMVATAVVCMQMGVDDDVDAGEIQVLLGERMEDWIELGRERVKLRHAGVDQHPCLGMVDEVHVERHVLALDEQVGDEDGRDRDRGGGTHGVESPAESLASSEKSAAVSP